MSVSAEVRKAMAETIVENMGPAQHYAQMDTITNPVNSEVNLSVTSGQVLDVRGVNLSVKGTDPTVGLYLQEEGAKDSTRLRVTTLLVNEPKHLIFMIPTGLTLGSFYRIVHISQTSSGGGSSQLLKTPRIEFSTTLLKATDGTPIPGDDSDENPDIL